MRNKARKQFQEIIQPAFSDSGGIIALWSLPPPLPIQILPLSNSQEVNTIELTARLVLGQDLSLGHINFNQAAKVKQIVWDYIFRISALKLVQVFLQPVLVLEILITWNAAQQSARWHLLSYGHLPLKRKTADWEGFGFGFFPYSRAESAGAGQDQSSCRIWGKKIGGGNGMVRFPAKSYVMQVRAG